MQNENKRTTERLEILLSAIDTAADDKLTRFPLRLALAVHGGILRDGECDFLTEAENVCVHQHSKQKAATKKTKQPYPDRSSREGQSRS